MQALLSRAVEEQVSEQRAVSTVLAELRSQVAALSEGVRLAASDASVERLGGVVSTVVADLRTSTSLLGQRIEALAKRVDAVAADTAAPTEQAAVRLAGLAGDIAAQADAVGRMETALDQLASFPGALAALQKDVAGLHDRLQPLAEVRAGVGDLSARTSHSLETIRPQLEALLGKVEALGAVPDAERLRDAVVDAHSGRLDRTE
jgi:ABC-type transporter Mla subunit MlaD